jgi:hypothetical protein
MSETLLAYQQTVAAADGTEYEARACGSAMSDGLWQGWLEFIPVRGGTPVRSPRETTQPNRSDTEYWATGLTTVYLEGALQRALAEPTRVVTMKREPSVFQGPAPQEVGAESVLDPFSVYEKGEALLRRQLGALSAWHLVNIITAYRLSDEPMERLNHLPAAQLIDVIVAGVRTQKSQSAAR